MEFRYSRCIRQGGVEAPVLWGRVAKYVLWKAEEKWRAKGWGSPFPGQPDNDCVLRGMMWADNYWVISDNKERVFRVVDGIIEEVLDLDMEPKAESLWWTSTHKDEDMTTHREAEAKLGTSLFVKSLRSWDIVITGMGKDPKAQNELCARALGTISCTAQRRCPS